MGYSKPHRSLLLGAATDQSCERQLESAISRTGAAIATALAVPTYTLLLCTQGGGGQQIKTKSNKLEEPPLDTVEFKTTDDEVQLLWGIKCKSTHFHWNWLID